MNMWKYWNLKQVTKMRIEQKNKHVIEKQIKKIKRFLNKNYGKK